MGSDLLDGCTVCWVDLEDTMEDTGEVLAGRLWDLVFALFY
jgi:hypothetical protein